jgi:hypothetical protein
MSRTKELTPINQSQPKQSRTYISISSYDLLDHIFKIGGWPSLWLLPGRTLLVEYQYGFPCKARQGRRWLVCGRMPCLARMCVSGEGRARSTRQHQGSDRRVALGGRSEGHVQRRKSEPTRNSRLGLAEWRAAQPLRGFELAGGRPLAVFQGVGGFGFFVIVSLLSPVRIQS